MAHNAYIRGSIGAWATGTQVSQAEFWQMDQNMYSAINGDAGGTWAPAATITLGGTAGLVLGAGNPLTVGGLLSANGGTNTNAMNALSATVIGDTALGSSLSDTLTVASTSTFSSPVVFNGSATLNDPVTTTDTVAINGTTTLTVASTVTTTIAGDISAGSTPGSTGKATTLAGDLVSAGSGGRVALSFLNIGDTSVSTGYYYRFLASPSVLRTLSLSLATPRVGTEFHVSNIGAATLDVYIGGGPFTSVLSNTSATIVWSGANWYRLP